MCKHTDIVQTRKQIIRSKFFQEMYKNLNNYTFKGKIEFYVIYKKKTEQKF